jgi:hypothetical protein
MERSMKKAGVKIMTNSSWENWYFRRREAFVKQLKEK